MKWITALIILFSFTNCSAQNKTIDSLKERLSISKEDTNKVWILDDLSLSYAWSFADTGVMYGEEGLRLAQKMGFKEGEATCMSDLCYGLTILGNYSTALDWGYKSLSLFQSLRDTSGLVFAIGALGDCYRELGDYQQALHFFHEEYRLVQIINERSTHLMRSVYGNLASVYVRNNQLDSALIFATKSYRLVKDWSGNLYVLGEVYYKLGKDSLALSYYNQAIPFAKRNNVQKDIIDCYSGMAQVFLREGKKDSAIYYTKEALNIQWGRTYPLGLLNASQLLTNIYESENNTDSTLKYLKYTLTLKDSLFNKQKTREAQSYAFNEQLHQQELAAQQQQNITKMRTYALLFIVGIILLIAFFLYRNNRQKQKAFALLSKQKMEIDVQKQKVEQTLEELKSTQAQLIQSEKMASLGELTAGIAHEIQNPLNFINNFSEVDIELIDELYAAIRSGNTTEVEQVMDSLKNNLLKINHHGKRADAIVKGMLQHSRASTGQQEPTDINALAEEYFQLSYHGLRARDNSFNTAMESHFDENTGKINIVPQDLGRVLLNIFNNAFYAVFEKKKLRGETYSPLVILSTRKEPDRVKIMIIDNGAGIPPLIIDKIFQPFFTTKSPGQGTGLGLSLSYDIVKAHGGTISVESKENEGSKFIVTLPL